MINKRGIDIDEQNDVKNFITKFCENTIIFDPLDRDIFENGDEEKVISTK